MVFLEKTRTPRSRSRTRTRFQTEIRCRANALPFKAILYAIAHAKQKVCRKRNTNATLFAPRLISHMRELSTAIDGLKALDPSPSSDPSALRTAVSTYVNLFYSLSKDERKRYIDALSGKHTKLKPEKNLLVIPALGAELRMPKDEVVGILYGSLYRMPFKIFHDSCKSALQVAMLEQSMAIKSMSTDTIEKFSRSMSKIESRMKSIENGHIMPTGDEEAKADFIESAIEFSNATDINVAGLISEKVGTENAIRARMQRLIRKAKY